MEVMEKITSRQRFDRWLEQRGQDLVFREGFKNEPPDPEEDKIFEMIGLVGQQLRETTSLLDHHPLPTQVGEIRLMDASMTPDYYGTLFVTVIEIAEGMATLVPFSPYMDAASLFETNLKYPIADILQALQIWNLRRLPLQVLEKSWKAGELHEEDLQITLAVAKASFAGNPPGKEIIENCGTQIRHPLDPRRAYLEEQADIMDLIEAEGMIIYRQ